MRPTVVYWNNAPSPYMVERFNALARRDPFEFQAWFSTRRASNRSWDVVEESWDFPYRYLPSIGHGEHPLAVPTPLFRGQPPDLVVSLYASSAFLLGSNLARLRGARIAYWAEVTFDAWLKRRGWKEKIKSHALSRADAVLTAGSDGEAYVRRYGAMPERTFVVPHVIDAGFYLRTSQISAVERADMRKQLGLHGVTFIYVGRLWWGKGLSYLAGAFSQLQRASSDEVSLLVVGDGPEDSALREQCRTLGVRNVTFAGFQHPDVLAKMYGASDVFVFPTLGDPFGMVVNEAMACGLPVISTSAAGEIGSRVTDGFNGYIVPPADASALEASMVRITKDPMLRARLGAQAAESVAHQSPSLWADAFEDAVSRILSLPAKRKG